MEASNIFSGKKNKKRNKMSSAEFFTQMQSVKMVIRADYGDYRVDVLQEEKMHYSKEATILL